jgi:hypothetical protein
LTIEGCAWRVTIKYNWAETKTLVLFSTPTGLAMIAKLILLPRGFFEKKSLIKLLIGFVGRGRMISLFRERFRTLPRPRVSCPQAQLSFIPKSTLGGLRRCSISVSLDVSQATVLEPIQSTTTLRRRRTLSHAPPGHHVALDGEPSELRQSGTAHDSTLAWDNFVRNQHEIEKHNKYHQESMQFASS